MQLSPSYSLADLTVTDYPDLQDTPKPEAVEQLRLLAQSLERAQTLVRQALGQDARLTVNSGYRSAALNRRVDGEPSSQHPHGQAADLIPLGCGVREAWEVLRAHPEELNLRQLILYPNRGFIHFAILGPGYPTRKPGAQIKDPNKPRLVLAGWLKDGGEAGTRPFPGAGSSSCSACSPEESPAAAPGDTSGA